MEESVDAKVRFCLEGMEKALEEKKAPRFREFWQMRQRCLPLFKEAMPPKLRAQLWSRYIELATESKRLKEIVDEESAFLVEQIELALQALERDVGLQQYPPDRDLGVNNLAMKGRGEAYCSLQGELRGLSAYAARIQALRKEVLGIEMRIRAKNQLLSRLSLCGDQVFPKRKEGIHTLSSWFLEDVSVFIETHFHQEEIRSLPFYALREEIKALQAVAKVLMLDAPAFTQSRLQLSACWDQLKEKGRQIKKQREERVEREPVEDLFLQLKAKLEAQLAAQDVPEEIDETMLQREKKSLRPGELQMLESLLKQLEDRVRGKKTQELLAQLEEEGLEVLLEAHQRRRLEIKQHLEVYRKILGGSGLDFEQAILYRERIEAEKGALVQVEDWIAQIEETR